MADPLITRPMVLAAANVFMDALRQEFVRRWPEREPETKPLAAYSPQDQAVIIRATARMLKAAAKAS